VPKRGERRLDFEGMRGCIGPLLPVGILPSCTSCLYTTDALKRPPFALISSAYVLNRRSWHYSFSAAGFGGFRAGLFGYNPVPGAVNPWPHLLRNWCGLVKQKTTSVDKNLSRMTNPVTAITAHTTLGARVRTSLWFGLDLVESRQIVDKSQEKHGGFQARMADR